MLSLKKFLKKYSSVLALFLLFLITRLLGSDLHYWYESSSWIRQIVEFISFGQNLDIIPHTPFTAFIYKIAVFIFGGDLIGIRYIHILFSIGVLFLIYHLVWELYKDKRIALASIFVYTISFHALIGSNFQVDQDSVINPFLFLLVIYTYCKIQQRFTIWRILSLALIIAILSYSRLILGVIVLLVLTGDTFIRIFFFETHSLKDKIFSFIIKSIKIAFPTIVFSIFFFSLSLYFFPENTTRELLLYKGLFGHIGETPGQDIIVKIAFLGQIFLYTTPLILSPFLLLKEWRKHQIILLSYFLLLFYALNGLNGGDPARWIMPIIPFFVICTSVLVAKILSWKDTFLIGIITLSLISSNFLLRYELLPHGIGDYVHNIPEKIYILSSTVSFPIYIHTLALICIITLCLLSFFLYFFTKRDSLLRVFLAGAIAYNIFMVSNIVLGFGQPDVLRAHQYLRDFCYDNCTMEDKVYTDQASRDTALLGILEREIGNSFSLQKDANKSETLEKIRKNLIVIKNINLFTLQTTKSDIQAFFEQLRLHGAGYVFLTNYLGTEFNHLLLLFLREHCHLRGSYNANEFINSQVWYCDSNIPTKILKN